MLTCTHECQVASAEKMRDLLTAQGVNMLAINESRFKFQAEEYTKVFEVQAITPHDFLLTLKSPVQRSP